MFVYLRQQIRILASLTEYLGRLPYHIVEVSHKLSIHRRSRLNASLLGRTRSRGYQISGLRIDDQELSKELGRAYHVRIHFRKIFGVLVILIILPCVIKQPDSSRRPKSRRRVIYRLSSSPQVVIVVHYPRISGLICIVASVVINRVLIGRSDTSALSQLVERVYKRFFAVAYVKRLRRPVIHFRVYIYSILTVPRSRERGVPFTGEVERLTLLNRYLALGRIAAVSRT